MCFWVNATLKTTSIYETDIPSVRLPTKHSEWLSQNRTDHKTVEGSFPIIIVDLWALNKYALTPLIIVCAKNFYAKPYVQCFCEREATDQGPATSSY